MPDAKDPITFKFFIRDPSLPPAKDNPYLKKITELTGVTIEWEFLVGDLDQKTGVMIAGEDYPDAIFATASKFIDAGAFIPLEDLIPQYPNLQAHYGPHAQKMTKEDGHQYILEIFSVMKNVAPVFTNTGAGFFIQKDVLVEGGYKIPRTLDEYFDLIESYKTKYPEINGVKTIGFEILTDGWRDFCLRNPAQHLMGAGNDGDVYVNLDTYEAEVYQISESAKSYYKKLNEEYHKGIIEAETLVQSYDQYISRISTGAVLGFFDQGWNFGSANNLLKNEGKFERTYVSVPVTDPGVQDGYVDARSTTISGNNGIGITKNCKNPERLLAFLDWLLQPEVQDFLQWGVEGDTYEELAGNGRRLTAKGRAIAQDEVRRRDEFGYLLSNYTPKREGLYDNGKATGPRFAEDEYLASLSEYDQKFLNRFGVKYDAQLMSPPVKRPAYYPVWSMSIEEGSPAKVANQKFVNVCRKYYPQMVLAKNDAEFNKLWNDFVKDFNAANPKPYLDEVNRQIKVLMGM